MKKINKIFLKCVAIAVLIGISFVRSYAQGTPLNETTLESTIYQNYKKGINPFENILEQHVYTIDKKTSSKNVTTLIQEIKKDEKIISVLKEEDKIIVLITKSEMQDAAYRITPLFDMLKISVVSNYVLFYLRNN